jgi:hypothetical protein
MGMGFVTFGAHQRLDLVKDLFNNPAKLTIVRDWFMQRLGADQNFFYALGDICGIVFDNVGLNGALDLPGDPFTATRWREWQLYLRFQYREHRRKPDRMAIEDGFAEVLGDPNRGKTLDVNFVGSGYARPDLVWQGPLLKMVIYFDP